ncbi:MAG TPA: hypothetical protein VHF08_06850 [Nitrososphaeraceae archaeon]|nr:hypothetical protein [Nitrososphaeraceae archaeon]
MIRKVIMITFFYNIWIKHPLVATMSKDENNAFRKQGTFTGKLAF